MNTNIIESFQALITKTQNEMKETNNKSLSFKINTYRKVIKIISQLNFEITSGSQLKDYKGIGKKSLEKIDEILSSGTLKTIKDVDASNTQELFELQRITGIGPVKANTLLSKGITLQQLLKINFSNPCLNDKKLLKDLTHHQILGIKYLHDIESRIPYKEIELIETYLNKIIKSLSKDLNIIICGSYRRKKATSGDIDVLVYSKEFNTLDKTKKSDCLFKFLEFLNSQGFLKDNLTSFDNPTKYMGFCKLDGISPFCRRIDIRLVPYNSLGSAMLYFTGSGDFNKNMRTFANQKNYTINEYGIYKMKDRKKTFKLKTQSEKDIFRILGIDYVEPENRSPQFKFE